jgi:hypothetical protein
MTNHIANQQENLFESKVNLLGPLADYISTPNIFDMFDFFEDNKITNFPLHNSLNVNTNSISLEELMVVSSNTTLSNPFLQKKQNAFLNTNELLNNFEPIFQPLADDIQRFSINTNNLYELNEIFPEKTTQFECFEFSSLESDISSYEALSTPETKIFYPEPFVASPSFVLVYL